MSSTKIDIEVIGASGTQKHRVAASATRFYAGEPLNLAAMTYTSGVSDINTVTQAADGTPVIATDTSGTQASFVGVAAEDAPVGSDTTVDAGWVTVTEPIAHFTRLRSKAKTAASCDTLSELIGLIYDVYLFDLTSTVFTFDAAGADTGGLRCVGGIWEKSMLDVVVDARAMRVDITT